MAQFDSESRMVHRHHELTGFKLFVVNDVSDIVYGGDFQASLYSLAVQLEARFLCGKTLKDAVNVLQNVGLQPVTDTFVFVVQ
jgi:hypothetical protein